MGTEHVLPAQFYPRRQLTGEEELMLAVVEQACRDALLVGAVSPLKAATPHARAIRASVRRWVESPRRDHPFAFLRICDHFEWESKRLRGWFLLAIKDEVKCNFSWSRAIGA